MKPLAFLKKQFKRFKGKYANKMMTTNRDCHCGCGKGKKSVTTKDL